MRIVGYYIHGNKQYVAFCEDEGELDRFKITDGFHDRVINERNASKYKSYHWADKQEVDLKKIISRMRGTRPWHPLLKLLYKESAV